jgi:hypothetical protein
MGFSTKEYSWSSVDIAIGGKVLSTCQAVEFNEKIAVEKLRGKGNKAFQIADGDIDVSGSIEVLQSELETILNQTGNKGVAGMRDLLLTICYKEPTSGRLSTRSVIGVRVTEIGEAIKQSEMKIVVKLPFEALDVVYS